MVVSKTELIQDHTRRPTLKELGVDFEEPLGLSILKAPVEVVVVDFGWEQVYVARLGVRIARSELETLLATLKTNPSSHGLSGARADWEHPEKVDDHRKMNPEKWDAMSDEIASFIKVAEFVGPDEGLLNQLNFHLWDRMVNKTLVGADIYYSSTDGLFTHPQWGAKRIATAFCAYGKTLGRDVFERYKSNLGIHGLLMSMKELDDVVRQKSINWLVRERQAVAVENREVVSQFLQCLGDSPMARFWKIACLVSNNWDMETLQKLLLDRQRWPVNTEYGSIKMSLKKRGVAVWSDYDQFPARIIEVIENESLEDRILNPVIRVLNPMPIEVPVLVPVLAWKKREEGRRIERKWIYETPGEVMKAVFDDVRFGQEEYPSSVAGLLCLAYLIPAVRRHFPQRLPFHKGGNEQELLEGQMLFVVPGFFESALLKAGQVKRFEEVAV